MTPYLVNVGPGDAGLQAKVFFIWAGCCFICIGFVWAMSEFPCDNFTPDHITDILPHSLRDQGTLPRASRRTLRQGASRMAIGRLCPYCLLPGGPGGIGQQSPNVARRCRGYRYAQEECHTRGADGLRAQALGDFWDDTNSSPIL